jgi:hypothetical protein
LFVKLKTIIIVVGGSFVGRDTLVDMLIVEWANQTVAEAYKKQIHPLVRMIV